MSWLTKLELPEEVTQILFTDHFAVGVIIVLSQPHKMITALSAAYRNVAEGHAKARLFRARAALLEAKAEQLKAKAKTKAKTKAKAKAKQSKRKKKSGRPSSR